MLKTILSITGKPGLYKLVSHAKNMLIVESLADKRRVPAYAKDKVISLGDIAMYTTDTEVPLHEVLTNMKNKENGNPTALSPSKASTEELRRGAIGSPYTQPSHPSTAYIPCQWAAAHPSGMGNRRERHRR